MGLTIASEMVAKGVEVQDALSALRLFAYTMVERCGNEGG